MNSTRLLTSTFTYLLDRSDTLFSKSPAGLTASLKGVARGVALAFVGVLCLAGCASQQGSKDAIQKPITDKQLITRFVKPITSEKQYLCFYDLAYRESRWNFLAKNGSHYGFMQGHSDYLKNAKPIQQLLWSWDYVSVRYGVTPLDEPNWCKALDHLKKKGWH